MRPKLNPSPEIREKAIRMYGEAISEEHICQKIGCSRTVFKRILSDANISERLQLNLSHPRCLYSCNESFFDNPEAWTENQAYWLGWMYSDGFNSGKQFGVKLQVTDLHILEELKKAIEYTGPISIKSRKPESIFGKPAKQYQDRAILCISNPRVCKKLAALGIVRNKASSAEFPTYLRKDLIPHFLRGLYDGDGTFCFTRYNKFETNLLANEKTLLKIQSIYDDLGLYGYVNKFGYNNGVKMHRLCGNEKGIKLFNFLYKDATLFLKRKLVPFVKLKEYKSGTTLIHKSMKSHCDTFYELIKRFE